MKSRQILVCPSAPRSTSVSSSIKDDGLISYWAAGGFFGRRNNRGVVASIPMALVEEPTIWPMIYDGLTSTSNAEIVFRPFWYAQSKTSGSGLYKYRHFETFYPGQTARHLETVNVLYGDGHVKAQQLMNFYQQACPSVTPDIDYTKTARNDCDGKPTPQLPN